MDGSRLRVEISRGRRDQGFGMGGGGFGGGRMGMGMGMGRGGFGGGRGGGELRSPSFVSSVFLNFLSLRCVCVMHKAAEAVAVSDTAIVFNSLGVPFFSCQGKRVPVILPRRIM